jgi:hypothetical protein
MSPQARLPRSREAAKSGRSRRTHSPHRWSSAGGEESELSVKNLRVDLWVPAYLSCCLLAISPHAIGRAQISTLQIHKNWVYSPFSDYGNSRGLIVAASGSVASIHPSYGVVNPPSVRLHQLESLSAGTNFREAARWQFIARESIWIARALLVGLCEHESCIEKSVATDCAFVTKCLCEKSLNKPRCISYS